MSLEDHADIITPLVVVPALICTRYEVPATSPTILVEVFEVVMPVLQSVGWEQVVVSAHILSSYDVAAVTAVHCVASEVLFAPVLA